MPGSLRVARLGETEIAVHLSFLPVLAWAGWLGAAKYGSLSGALFDVLAVVLLFVCVLVHELAHTLYGRAVGLRTRNILLLPIGGLTSMESAPAHPRDEIQVALAGPLANLALGLACSGAILVGAAGLTDDLGALIMDSLRQPSLVGLLTYLAAANLLLFFFNLVPAFPLDGGRVLRAALSMRLRYEVATHYAAILGRSFGAALIVIGITLLMLAMVSYGVAVIIVGAVLYYGATYEDRETQRHAALRNWTVGQLAHAPVQKVAPYDPLSVALLSVAKGQVVPVVLGEQDRLIGLLTSSELSGRTGALDGLSVAHVMRTRFPIVRAGDPLWVAYEKLHRSQLFAIPVVNRETDGLDGLVSLADIRRVLREGGQPAPLH